MEDFVPNEIAVKLKQKGFPLTEVWRQNGNPIMYELPFDDPKWMDCKAWYIPTIYQVMKWLREEKKLHISVLVITDCSKDAELSICEEWSFWSFSITNLNDGSTMYDDFEKSDCIEFQSYELAALAGIEYALDNLI